MKGYYFQVSNGLLKDRHCIRMGSAIWEFMWLLDRMTSISENGIGKVLGGRPIKTEEITSSLGINRKYINIHLRKLKEQGYINITRAPYGLIISINKAQKTFGQKAKPDVMKTSHLRDIPKTSHLVPKTSHLETENISSNKTRQLDKTIDKTTPPSASKLIHKVSISADTTPKLEQRIIIDTTPVLGGTTQTSMSFNSQLLSSKGKPMNKHDKKNKWITSYSNEELIAVNALQKYFRLKMNLPEEDGRSEESSFKYWKKLWLDNSKQTAKVERLIDLAHADEYLGPNITSSYDLYTKRVKLITRSNMTVGKDKPEELDGHTGEAFLRSFDEQEAKRKGITVEEEMLRREKKEKLKEEADKELEAIDNRIVEKIKERDFKEADRLEKEKKKLKQEYQQRGETL